VFFPARSVTGIAFAVSNSLAKQNVIELNH